MSLTGARSSCCAAGVPMPISRACYRSARAELRDLLAAHVDAGLSKFVVRPVDADGDRHRALSELADLLLPLQT